MKPQVAAERISPARLQERLGTFMPRAVLIAERAVKPHVPVLTGTLRRSVTGRVMTVTRGQVGTNLRYARRVHERVPYLVLGARTAVPEIKQLFIQTVQGFGR